jgi:predicted MPP superfamily phosphohydrolase
MRIVHASDFHCSRTVTAKYLQRCIDRINALEPDVIVLTGDYITHDRTGRFSERVSELLAKLKSRYGIYAALGNHDYGIGGAIRIDRNGGLDEMIDRFEAGGIRVLRNEAQCLQIDGHKLWFVGLGDVWAYDCDPAKAFAQVDSAGPVIALVHNPDSARHLSGFDYDAIVCGHTHGCRYEWTTLPDRPLLMRRRFKAGMYRLGERSLYVNRGLGRHGRLFNKRPEITVFTLC